MLEMFAFVDKILDVKLRPTFVDGVSSSEWDHAWHYYCNDLEVVVLYCFREIRLMI